MAACTGRKGTRLGAALAALMAAAVLASCGGDDGAEQSDPDDPQVSQALELASEAADLESRLALAAERISESPGERAEYSDDLAALSSDGSRLAGRVEGELDGELARELAGAAACLQGVGAQLGEAADADLGEPAQSAARIARKEARTCAKRLSTALEQLGETGADLLARATAQGEGLDALLGELVQALAATEAPADEPSTPPQPVAPATPPAGDPAPELPPTTGPENETADLPLCSDAPPPCR